MWNNFLSSFFEVDIGIGQGSAVYLLLVFYIFEKHIKNLKIPVLFLYFVDNRLFISQEKSFEKNQCFFFVAIILFLLSWTNLAWLLNMRRLKSFIFLDLKITSISLL